MLSAVQRVANPKFVRASGSTRKHDSRGTTAIRAMATPNDPSSQSNYPVSKVTHCDFDLTVDFEKKSVGAPPCSPRPWAPMPRRTRSCWTRATS